MGIKPFQRLMTTKLTAETAMAPNKTNFSPLNKRYRFKSILFHLSLLNRFQTRRRWLAIDGVIAELRSACETVTC